MKYTAWLWRQLEDVGPGHAFAKVCWDDVNNGCASTKFSANDWLLHFEEKHSDKKDKLISQLLISFAEYQKASVLHEKIR
jgi:hypothetical protein